MLFINPACIFSFAWLCVLFFYVLHFSNWLLPLSGKTLNYVWLSIVAYLLSWAVSYFLNHKNTVRPSNSNRSFTPVENARLRILVIIFLFGSIMTLVYFHDLPILAVFGLSNMSYAQYGIHSLQGFLNAILESVAMYMLYLYLTNGHKKYLIYVLLTWIFPVLIFNRGMLTVMLVQSLFTMLVFKKIKFRSSLKLFALVVGFVFVFSFLGDVRYIGHRIHFDLIELSNISNSYPSWMPKSFMAVYLYITTPLNNVNNVISQFNYISFYPYTLIYSLLPSIIRDQWPLVVNVRLVNSTFNVSSFMPNYLNAFGYVGSIIFYFFAGLIPLYFYYRFLFTKHLKYGFVLVIFLQEILLSVFTDCFFSATYVFQILLQYYVFGFALKRQTFVWTPIVAVSTE